MIDFVDVRMTYNDTVVLGPVTGSIARGGITALVGPNGAGKSTLLGIIGRLIEPGSGTVTVGGLDVRASDARELARTLSILRQENQVSARLTVRDLVGFGRFPHCQGRLRAEDHAQVASSLEFLNLTPLADRFIDELSGGQRQRAFVAMVLAQDTEYVLLDEPLNSMDMKHAVLMMRQLRRAADELGKTIVLVVHDINIAAAYSDRIVALCEGQVAGSGTPAEIMREDVLSRVFDTPVRVFDVDGQPTAVYTR